MEVQEGGVEGKVGRRRSGEGIYQRRVSFKRNGSTIDGKHLACIHTARNSALPSSTSSCTYR